MFGRISRDFTAITGDYEDLAASHANFFAKFVLYAGLVKHPWPFLEALLKVVSASKYPSFINQQKGQGRCWNVDIVLSRVPHFCPVFHFSSLAVPPKCQYYIFLGSSELLELSNMFHSHCFLDTTQRPTSVIIRSGTLLDMFITDLIIPGVLVADTIEHPSNELLTEKNVAACK